MKIHSYKKGHVCDKIERGERLKIGRSYDSITPCFVAKPGLPEKKNNLKNFRKREIWGNVLRSNKVYSKFMKVT